MSLNLIEQPGSNYSIEASFGTRFITLVIDSICIAVLQIIVIAVIAVIVNGIAMGIISSSPTDSGEPSAAVQILFSLMGLLVTFLPFGCYLLYYIVFEHYFQRTLGKFIVGTIVVNEIDGRPTFGQIVGRTFCRLIPFEPIIALFTTSFLHDSLSSTKVVDKVR